MVGLSAPAQALQHTHPHHPHTHAKRRAGAARSVAAAAVVAGAPLAAEGEPACAKRKEEDGRSYVYMLRPNCTRTSGTPRCANGLSRFV